MNVLVIGESCKDIFYYGDSSRLCPEAPVPVFKATNKIENGGMAKNIQNNLKKLNVNAKIVTNDNWRSIRKTRYVDYRTNHMFLRVDENDHLYGEIDLDRLRTIDMSKYDAIIYSNSNNEVFDNDEQKIAFQNFIKKGGGFMAIHSASAVERDWPWYWSLVGGKFVRHAPHQEFDTNWSYTDHTKMMFLPIEC